MNLFFVITTKKAKTSSIKLVCSKTAFFSVRFRLPFPFLLLLEP